MYTGPVGYGAYQTSDYLAQEQPASSSQMLGIAGLIGWAGLGLTHGALTKDSFAQMNPKLVSGARGRTGTTLDTFLGRYYQNKYPGNVAKFNRGIKEGAKPAEILTRSKFTSAAKRSMGRAAMGTVTGKMLSGLNFLFLAPMLYGLTYHGFKGIQKLGYELESPQAGRNFTMPTQAFTDRSRAIRRMHDSEFSGRQFLGAEAGILHR